VLLLLAPILRRIFCYSEEVAQTIQRVAAIVYPERLWANPDCGLNHLPRDVAFGKLKAMTAGV
jgi:5-methyltetrahydropteroyltriglutamate--homocysteine methyltransferase